MHHPTGVFFGGRQGEEPVAPRAWQRINNRPPPRHEHSTVPQMETPLSDDSSAASRASRKPLHPKHVIASTHRLPGNNIQPPRIWKPLSVCSAIISLQFSGVHHLTGLLRERVSKAETRYIQSMASYQPIISPASTSNRPTNGNP